MATQTTTLFMPDKHEHMRLPYKTAGIHLLGWLVFTSYELSVLYFHAGHLEKLTVYLGYYLLNISFFYLHLYLLQQNFDRERPAYLPFIIQWILSFTLFLLLKFSADDFYYPSQSHLPLHWIFSGTILSDSAYRLITFSLLATVYWVAGRIAVYRSKALIAEQKELWALNRRNELELQLSSVQNAYLRQQINPHLLFNALNFIHSSIYRHSEQGARCVVLLAELMRYSLEGAGQDEKSLISSEAAQLKNLIDLNRFRFDYPLSLKILIAPDFGTARMIPLVLLTLAENMFKHGIFSNPDQKGEISLNVSSANVLEFRTFNYKKTKSTYRRTSRVGLQNLTTRLEYAYWGKYHLEITETETTYESYLTLCL